MKSGFPFLITFFLLQSVSELAVSSRPHVIDGKDWDKLALEADIITPRAGSIAAQAALGGGNWTFGHQIKTELPKLAARALAWPVVMHPCVALPMAALDKIGPPAYFVQIAKIVSARTIPFEVPGTASFTAYPEEQFEVLPEITGYEAEEMVPGIAMLLIATCACTCCHRSRVVNQRGLLKRPFQVSMRSPPHAFHHDLITCCSLDTMCFACWCAPIRHASTIATSGFLGYWTVVFIFWATEIIGLFLYVFSPSYEAYVPGNPELLIAPLRALVLTIIFVHTRYLLRLKLGSPSPGIAVLFWDALSWFFCAPCSVAQEGRMVDLAQGIQVSHCLCTYRDLDPGEVVGPAVSSKRSQDS